MDVAGLVIGVLALVAAALAAWFAYPTWRAVRARPDLRVTGDLFGFSAPSGNRSLSLHLSLRNDGAAPAIGWRLIGISHKHRWDSFDDTKPPRFSARLQDYGWSFTWRGRDADDTIEPGQNVRIGVGIPNFSPEDRVEANLIIQARGMDDRRGMIRVTWPKDQDEPRILVV